MLPHPPPQTPLGSPISPENGESGVFQDEDALAGTEAFNVYGVDGVRLGRWEAAQGTTDERLLEAFGELLERRQPRLRLIPPSPPAAS